MSAENRKFHRSTRLIASAAVMALSAVLTLAPAASATPMELCPLEQGPNGVQCQKPAVEKPNFELCDLEQGPNGLQCKKPGFEKPDFELCDLEQGPNGPQCVDDNPDPEDPGPDLEPEPEEPPVDPEPQPEPQPEPEPEPETKLEPEGQPQAEQPAAGTGQAPADAVRIASDESGLPTLQAPTTPVADPDGMPLAGWVALALTTAGVIFLVVRRRRSNDGAELDQS